MLKSAARSDSDGKQRGRDADDGERDDRYCASAGAAGRTTTTTSRLRRAALRRWRRLRFDRFSLAAAPPPRALAPRTPAVITRTRRSGSRLWKTTQFSSRRSWRR